MLVSLRIKNLALIDSAHLSFGPGLSAVTGESGSGKSILLDSLALVSGASRGRIRPTTGASSGFVEAEFRLPEAAGAVQMSTELHRVLDEHGLLEACSAPGEPLIVARRIDASGRTRCFIQGQTVTRALLSEVGGHLLELCGQSAAHNLRTPAAQLIALDRFARLGARRGEVSRLVHELKQREAEVMTLERTCDEAERRRDFVEFQLAELAEVELSGLEERRARLDALTEATAALSSHAELVATLDESEHAVISRLRWLSARLSNHTRGELPPALSVAIATIDSAVLELEDIAHGSSLALADSERDQQEAEQLRAEFSSLYRLAQKHRTTVDELLVRQTQLEEELASFARLTDELLDKKSRLSAAREAARDAARELHAARLKAARLLDKKMKKELAAVGLAQAHFETRLGEGELTPMGYTQLEFLFSANPGHEVQSLSRVASGGELSRVLLCFRLATDSSGAMLIFDEIDAGAGGKTAEKIAAALRRAGKGGQVLCVTHWPQVAGIADHQFSVRKDILGGTTKTTVRLVSGEERLDEISRMLGGTEQTAREHANCLVKGAAVAA